MKKTNKLRTLGFNALALLKEDVNRNAFKVFSTQIIKDNASSNRMTKPFLTNLNPAKTKTKSTRVCSNSKNKTKN
jgi:hypothetical protein